METPRMYAGCFDIEIARMAEKNVIIGIGFALMDVEKKEIIRTELMEGYVKGMRIDQDHWDSFWSRQQDILKSLTFHGELKYVSFGDTHTAPSPDEDLYTKGEVARVCMCNTLLGCIRDAEKLALEENVPFFMVSDNMFFDVGNVNELIEYVFGAKARLPTSTLDPADYRLPMFLDLGCMQRTILSFANPEFLFAGKWGTADEVHRLSGLPDCPVVADHNPVTDAIAQLYEFLDILEVRKRYDLNFVPSLKRNDNKSYCL